MVELLPVLLMAQAPSVPILHIPTVHWLVIIEHYFRQFVLPLKFQLWFVPRRLLFELAGFRQQHQELRNLWMLEVRFDTNYEKREKISKNIILAKIGDCCLMHVHQNQLKAHHRALGPVSFSFIFSPFNVEMRFSHLWPSLEGRFVLSIYCLGCNWNGHRRRVGSSRCCRCRRCLWRWRLQQCLCRRRLCRNDAFYRHLSVSTICLIQ